MLTASPTGIPMRSRCKIWRSRSLLASVACLAVLLPAPGIAAAQEPAADADNSASDATADDSAGGVEMVRYAGLDQYELSLAVAQALVDAEGGASEWVVLASGESWADAATAGPLAASLGAPILLIPPGGLQTSAARPDLVEFLRSTGVRRVVIVGSPDVLPNHEPSMLFGLGMLPRNVERVHGDDPVGTSLAIAERLGVPAELGELGRTVIIANNQSVADAEAVGPLAASGPFPLLLTASDALDPHIAAYLAEQEVAHVVLVGGTAAIGPAVQEGIEAAGATVTRLAGRDRSDTARFAADLFEQHTADDSACTDGPTRIGLTPARHPGRAIAAGPLLAQQCTPLRYIELDRLPADLRNTLYLARQQAGGLEVLVFGDESAVADAVVNVALPPLRLAFVSVGEVTEDRTRSTQIAVVNEHGAIRLFPQTRVDVPAWLFPDSERVCRPSDLVWSPAGRFLSYQGLCTPEIFVLDTETGDSYQVAFDDSELIFSDLSREGGGWAHSYRVGPLWSPDGSSFVFTAFLDHPSTIGTWRGNPLHFAELFVHEAESRTTRRLTNNTVHDLVGSWTPDSKTVGTLRHEDPGIDPYYRVLLTSRCVRVSEVETAPRRPGCSSDPGAVWSPDGTHVAYSWAGLQGWPTRQVSVREAGGGSRQLTPVGCSECTEGHQHFGASILGWNPNGSMLAFSDTDYVQDDGVFDYKSETTADYVLDLESGEIRKLFEFTQESNSPTPLVFFGWSAEGDGLLYLRRSEDGSSYRDLVLLDDVTGDITTLRDIPLLQLSFGRQIQPRLLLSPDQSQLLLIYDGTWPRDALPRRDGGMWLTSVQSGDVAPLIDFGPVISVAEGDTPGVRRPARAAWRCETEWSANGISGICN